ncbi:HD-GYP domain-containing protein [Streptomyces sp. JJ36]|nr:HD-GYP domain-containing protein [Streptomyces sp. JJ36]
MSVRGAGRPGLPLGARALIASVALAAAACAAPVLLRPGGVDPRTLLALAALHALLEYAPRCPALRRHRPPSRTGGEHGGPAELCGPVLLTAVLLLPPGAAALVPLAGALTGRVAAGHAVARRLWRAAQLALAAAAAGGVLGALSAPLTRETAAGALPSALFPACAAALAFGAVRVALDGAILVAAEGCPPGRAWRGRFRRAAAPYLVQGPAGLLMAVVWRSPYGPVAALTVLLPMAVCCWVFAQYHRERAAHQATVRALVQAVDLKDRYTRGHGERVGRASVLIARELGMPEERVELLRFAGILHDVGKLGVPTRLLRKEGPLTAAERRVVERHPEYGHEMVRGIGFLREACTAVLHHHERLDGAGYPYGLAGRQIPEPARVVAVADAFDAMTSTRSYRRGRPVAAAVAELRRCAGTQFDPRMVDALARALERHGWHPAVTTDQPDMPVPAGAVLPPAGAGEAVGCPTAPSPAAACPALSPSAGPCPSVACPAVPCPSAGTSPARPSPARPSPAGAPPPAAAHPPYGTATGAAPGLPVHPAAPGSQATDTARGTSSSGPSSPEAAPGPSATPGAARPGRGGPRS